MVEGSVAIENARVVTCVPPAEGGALRGAAMRTLRVIERGHVVIERGMIAAVGDGPVTDRAVAMRSEARGRVAMPALVDCHTHACWAGDRFGEWELKRAGASYLEILKAGGGILSRISRRFGEGVVNGALTARVGVAAIEVCRPLPFRALPRPKTTTLVSRGLAGLFADGKEA
jgi:imidazolonepropionase-like amidohydrolase